MLGYQTLRKALEGTPELAGARKARDVMRELSDYGQSVIPGISSNSKKFYDELNKKGVNLKTPRELAGAVGTRLFVDVGSDGTRNVYWRYNHPMQIITRAYEGITPGLEAYNNDPVRKNAINLAAIGLPVGATLGTFDLTNIGELGRPKGFAQEYAEPGSDDRRQTTQVLPELANRFALGRQGRPLKFETAKQDIPDLTKQRYANYQNFLYNDKGPLGLGIIKGTTENLQGEPEIRLAGFPIGLQSLGAAIGGTAGVRLATEPNLQQGKVTKLSRGSKVVRPGQRVPASSVAAVGAGSALAGAVVGKLLNRAIATAGNPELPSTYEYDVATRNPSQPIYVSDLPDKAVAMTNEGKTLIDEDGKKYDEVVPPNEEFPKGLYSAGY